MHQNEGENGDRLAIKLDHTHYAVLGLPNASLTINGQVVRVRDDLGLPLDPRTYAKTRCRTCNGVGSYTVHRKPSMASVRVRFVEAHVWCGCAEERYRRARSLVQTTVKQKG